ncbi:glycerophosphodiester phosphodiesterase [Halobacillus naozhouensis]|uniref:Glycerophosphodiester phosphodiesterase n=2 Tax=Halobacillus naozhouensis TaxID=554880 RepID=A0ABY8IVI3_9BACI|nr:glycerophosphodiester phosphodiesterase [Halobacillus naozhouensis]WFT73179.1 glycerophosphodiester phosphodiesterase [Halobacillus naozhouensis]
MIYAHRGASKLAPENTMPAYDLASESGADGLEIDVQLTKDNIPVLIHDENVRRTTNGTGFVQDYTYDQLRLLDAGSWFSSKFSDCSIVTLDYFLRWFKNRSMQLNVELKTNVIHYNNIEAIVYDQLNYHQMLDRTVISSFNVASVEKITAIDSNVQTAFLTSIKRKHLPKYAYDHGASSLHVKYRMLDKALVKQCHHHRMPLRIYTVNRPSWMTKCFKLGCDGIFTDVPHEAVEQRDLFESK